jgi:hypothetical protein
MKRFFLSVGAWCSLILLSEALCLLKASGTREWSLCQATRRHATEFTILVTIAVSTSRLAVCLYSICCSGLAKLWILLPRPSKYTVCLSGRKSFSPWQRPFFWIRRNSTARSSVDNLVTIQLHASNLIMFVHRGAGCYDETQGVLQQTPTAICCVTEFHCIGLCVLDTRISWMSTNFMGYFHLQCVVNEWASITTFCFVRSPILPCRSDGDIKNL